MIANSSLSPTTITLSVAELDQLRTAVPAPPPPVAGSAGYALSLNGGRTVVDETSEKGQKQLVGHTHPPPP